MRSQLNLSRHSTQHQTTRESESSAFPWARAGTWVIIDAQKDTLILYIIAFDRMFAYGPGRCVYLEWLMCIMNIKSIFCLFSCKWTLTRIAASSIKWFGSICLWIVFIAVWMFEWTRMRREWDCLTSFSSGFESFKDIVKCHWPTYKRKLSIFNLLLRSSLIVSSSSILEKISVCFNSQCNFSCRKSLWL